MVPAKLRAKVVLERLSWVERMVAGVRSLPLESCDTFTARPHVPAAAESYLRRGLEALLNQGRHTLANGFGRAPAEYKSVATEGPEDIAIPDTMVRHAQLLDAYYVPTRYPNGFVEGKPADYYGEHKAREAMDAATEILRFCKDHIHRSG